MCYQSMQFLTYYWYSQCKIAFSYAMLFIGKTQNFSINENQIILQLQTNWYVGYPRLPKVISTST